MKEDKQYDKIKGWETKLLDFKDRSIEENI